VRKELLTDRVLELAKSRSHAVATRLHLLVVLLNDQEVNPPRWQAHLEVAERSLLPNGTSIDTPVLAADVQDLLDECSVASGVLAVEERLIAEFSDVGDLPVEEAAGDDAMPPTWSEGLDPYGFKVEADAFFCLSSSNKPVVRQVDILNESVDPGQGDVLLKVSVEAATDEPLLHPYEREFPALQIGEVKTCRDIRLIPNFAELASLDEQLAGNLLFEIFVGGEVVGRHRKPLTFFAYNQWWHNPQHFDSLSAFVHPNHPSLAPVIQRARVLLGERTGDPSTSGYQGPPDRERWLAMAEAVYDALCELDLVYTNPPASFEGFGQKVRTPDRVLEERAATCLDSTVLMASCLEAIGLDSVLVLVRGHAFVGLLMGGRVARSMGAMDPQGGVVPNQNDILDLFSKDHFVPIETTTMTVGIRKPFADAIAQVQRYFGRSGAGELTALIVPEECFRQTTDPVSPLPARRLVDGAVVGLDLPEPHIKPQRAGSTEVSEDSELFGAVPFETASTEALDNDCGLLDLLPDPAAVARVRELINETLTAEAPIHGERLTRIVGRRCGIARVSATRGKQILALVPTESREETDQGLFVWGSGWNPDNYSVFRRTPRGVTDRQIDHIAAQEIVNAAVHVLKSEFAAEPDELVKETSVALGYARCGSQMRYRIGEVLARAEDVDELVYDGTMYRLPNR
jgi:hypothetical protein